MIIVLPVILISLASAISMDADYRFSAIGGTFDDTITNGRNDYRELIDSSSAFATSRSASSDQDHLHITTIDLINFPIEESGQAKIEQTMKSQDERGRLITSLDGRNSLVILSTDIYLDDAYFETKAFLAMPWLFGAGAPIGEVSLDRGIYYAWLDPITNQYFEPGPYGTINLDAMGFGTITAQNGIYLRPSSHLLEASSCQGCDILSINGVG